AGEVELAAEGIENAVSEGHFGRAAQFAARTRFLPLLPCLGFALLGLVAMALRVIVNRGPPRSREWDFAKTALLLSAAATLVWILMIFGNSAVVTYLHTASLAVPLLAICALIVGAYASYPRFGIGLAIFNSAFALALYVPSFEPPPGTS